MDLCGNVADKWIEAIATVKFDLEEGQLIDFVYPKTRFSPPLLKLLAYFSFPDSYVFSPEGELYYVFALKSEDDEDLYCYTYFTQKKDATNPRGYFQKSIVLVSTLKMVKVFGVVLSAVNRIYFERQMDNEAMTKALLSLNANKPPDELFRSNAMCVVSILDKELKVRVNRVFGAVCRVFKRFSGLRHPGDDKFVKRELSRGSRNYPFSIRSIASASILTYMRYWDRSESILCLSCGKLRCLTDH